MGIFPVMTTGGGACLAFPDVCLTPTPGGPQPMPYLNKASCADSTAGSTKVQACGHNVLRDKDEITVTMGDEAGTGGGTQSGQFKGPAKPSMGCDKVKAEGKEVAYHTVRVAQNGNNANMPSGIHAQPSQQKVKVIGGAAGGGSGGGGGGGAGGGPGGSAAGAGAGDGTRDEYNGECPAANCASESMEGLTQAAAGADPAKAARAQEALSVLRQMDPGGKFSQGILGVSFGGGFLATSAGGNVTRAALKAGELVARFWGGASGADGAWWVRLGTSVENPTRDLAIPPGCRPENMQICEVVKDDAPALAGNGAPRCSNKPGGPEQLFFGPGPMRKGILKPVLSQKFVGLG